MHRLAALSASEADVHNPTNIHTVSKARSSQGLLLQSRGRNFLTENDRTNPLSYAILIEKKGTVLMEPIKIQKVIDYIEAHLTEELSYKQFAAMVAVSEADLQRSFKMITGVTISDYIRYSPVIMLPQ